MPIYGYRCENGHNFEVIQRMADGPVSVCQTCDAPVARVFHPVAVHFKGSGFYNTDYGTRRRSREMEQSASDGADRNDAKSKDKADKGDQGDQGKSSTGEGGGGDKGSSSSSSSSSKSSGSGSGKSTSKASG